MCPQPIGDGSLNGSMQRSVVMDQQALQRFGVARLRLPNQFITGPFVHACMLAICSDEAKPAPQSVLPAQAAARN